MPREDSTDSPLPLRSSFADDFSDPRTARASSPSIAWSGDRAAAERRAQTPSPSQRSTPNRLDSGNGVCDTGAFASDSEAAPWRSPVSHTPVLSPSTLLTPRTPSPSRPRPAIRFSRPSVSPFSNNAPEGDIFSTPSTPPTAWSSSQKAFPAVGEDGSLPQNIRLPPRPSDLPDPHSLPSSRETSPTRFPLPSPLVRIATVKHSRTQSSPMGFTGDRSPTRPGSSSGQMHHHHSASVGSPVGGAAGRLSQMFKTEAPSEQQRTGHSRRGSSLFNFGFNTSQSQPKRKSASIVEPTETIDEFAGLSFTALLEAYLEEPTGTPSTPAEAIMRTPEGRLSDAVTTATELLDRVYSAYRRRTESLQDTFAELELQKELLATEKNRSATFQLSLDRISQDAELKATESAGQISAQQTRIAELEAELAAERSRREKAEEQLQIRAIMNDRSKRASAASGSDSGFESDADSLASRTGSNAISPVASSSSSASEFMTELPHNCEGCVQKTLQVPSSGPPSAVATGAEPKQPTPLREAWAADGAAGVWGLFKSRNTPNNQSAGSWKDGRNANGVMVENQMLKQRITELEKAVDSALEAVAGRGV